MRKSASTSIETKMLTALRGLDLGMQCVGLMEVAAAGETKEQDLTAVQVRVHDFAQVSENGIAFTVAAEIRLNVEQAESADCRLFVDAHEKIALWLEHIMIDDNCAELDTDEAYVDGLQRMGGEKDFDTSGGVWFAVWNMTLSGRIKQEATNV